MFFVSVPSRGIRYVYYLNWKQDTIAVKVSVPSRGIRYVYGTRIVVLVDDLPVSVPSRGIRYVYYNRNKVIEEVEKTFPSPLGESGMSILNW